MRAGNTTRSACRAMEAMELSRPVLTDEPGQLVNHRDDSESGLLQDLDRAADDARVAERQAGASIEQVARDPLSSLQRGPGGGELVHTADLLEVGRERAAAAQQHLHVVSQRLRESPRQRQRQPLGAVEIRVVQTRPLSTVDRPGTCEALRRSLAGTRTHGPGRVRGAPLPPIRSTR